MAKTLESFQVALFFKQSTSFAVDKLCEFAAGSTPDTLERQKATGISTAIITDEQIQVRFVMTPLRCDIHFTAEMEPGPEFPPRSSVRAARVADRAKSISEKAGEFLGAIQRVGVVVASVERFPSSAAALVALKKALPFEFGAPPASEDVVVQYNVRRQIDGRHGAVELNQLHNKSIGIAQMFQFSTEGPPQVLTHTVLREALDVNTTGMGPEVSGARLSSVIDLIFSQMTKQMAID